MNGAHLRRSAVRVEPPAGAGQFQQLRGGGEAAAEAVLIRLESLHEMPCAESVRVAEGAATEGRPAEAEDRADVAVARRAEDVLAEAVCRLVDHLQDTAFRDFVARRRRALAPAG